MSIFRYNSRHKVVVGLLIIFYAAYSFTGEREPDVYDEKGNLKQTGSFRNGKNHGKWVWYYENRIKKLEGVFDNGVREGWWITFDKNGDTLNRSYYNNDKLNGLSIKYNLNIPKDTIVYINDIELN